MAAPALLSVENLQTHFGMIDGVVRAVEGLSFTIHAGETVAIVGESGCGKSVTSMSILRLIPTPPGKIAGRILFQGRDLLACSDAEMRAIRGKDISMIFQEPMTSLNPVLTIGRQIGESLRLHEGLSAKAAEARAVEMLTLVGIPAPARRVKEYPHQLSGGMRQRVMIAIALAANPRLLIADEPSTALDVTVQAQLLDLLRGLRRDAGLSLILITHDLGVIAEIADRVMVLYAGRVAETAPVRTLFDAPAPPYTQVLLASIPDITIRRPRLATIPGTVPAAGNMPQGCRFAPRCSYRHVLCERAPPALRPLSAEHEAACLRPFGELPA